MHTSPTGHQNQVIWRYPLGSSKKIGVPDEGTNYFLGDSSELEGEGKDGGAHWPVFGESFSRPLDVC